MARQSVSGLAKEPHARSIIQSAMGVNTGSGCGLQPRRPRQPLK
jgi:hypothetical protein